MVGERSWLVLLAVLFLSSVVDSQVIIRERAAIEPKAPAADGRPVSSRSATDLYFSPPLFVGGPTLTLTSTLTISGEIDIQGAIGGNQHVVIVVVLSGGSEHSVARKGREPIWWGGEMYEENDPYTGVFGKGPAPNVQMYLFDGSWGRASRQVRVTESGLEVEFEGYLQQGTFPAVRVRGRATITGEIVARSRFAGWIVRIAQGKARCGEPGYLQWAPVDGAGGWYQPAGIAIWGVSVMLSVEGEGPYVVLRYREEEEGEIIRWEEGEQISYTYRQLAEGRSEVWVVVDPSRGGRPVPGEVARVRLSGGGRSGMVEVPLECDGGLDHFEVTVDKDTVEYGTTAALRVQAKDGEGNDVELDDGELIRMMLRPAVIAGSVKGGSDLKGEMASLKVEGSSGGGKYGSFIVEGSEPVADEVEVGYGVVRQGKVRYLADGGVPSGPEPEEVMIVAELVEDETKNGWTVVVVRKLAPPLDHFVVRVNPDTVEHGKSAVITVIAQDASNNEVTIEGNTPLTFTVDKPEYGSIDPASGMTYGVARAGGVRYLANGTNPLTPQRIGITVAGAGTSGTGSVVVKGIEPELIVLKPAPGSSDKKIAPAPQMPQLEAEAQLKNFTGGAVQFIWNLRVRWTGPDGRLFDDEFKDQTNGQNSEVSTWVIPWDGKTRGGDDIKMTVVAMAAGKTHEAKVEKPYKILGENPTIAEVKAGLSLQEQVVVYLESFPKWKHFKADGLPIFGGPHGYGLMQLDNPPATDEQVWNWRENRAGGVRVLNNKLTLARRYGEDIRNGTVYGTRGKPNHPVPGGWYRYAGRVMKYHNATNLTTEEGLWKEAFHRYRGGVYWRWRPDNPENENTRGQWLAEPQRHNRGNEAWDIYQNVQRGNLPAGWN